MSKKKSKPKSSELEFDVIQELFPDLDDSDDLDVIYYEGYEAYQLEIGGNEVSICPYAIDGPERRAWFSGYRSARSDEDMKKEIE